jgi:hypothetical protein
MYITKWGDSDQGMSCKWEDGQRHAGERNKLQAGDEREGKCLGTTGGQGEK